MTEGPCFELRSRHHITRRKALLQITKRPKKWSRGCGPMVPTGDKSAVTLAPPCYAPTSPRFHHHLLVPHGGNPLSCPPWGGIQCPHCSVQCLVTNKLYVMKVRVCVCYIKRLVTPWLFQNHYSSKTCQFRGLNSVQTECFSNLAQGRILTWGKKERTVLVTVLETFFSSVSNRNVRS